MGWIFTFPSPLSLVVSVYNWFYSPIMDALKLVPEKVLIFLGLLFLLAEAVIVSPGARKCAVTVSGLSH